MNKNINDGNQTNHEATSVLLATNKTNSIHTFQQQKENENENENLIISTNIVQTSSKPIINTRTILWYLTFIGFAINYMIIININITIVDMVANQVNKKSSSSLMESSSGNGGSDNLNNLITQRECYNVSNIAVTDSNSTIDLLYRKPLNETSKSFSFERKILDFFQISYNKNGFLWNEKIQALILGSFFWLYWITQIPGGILARKYGTKLIFGLSNLIGCLLCSLMPIAAYLDYRSLLVLRVLQGCICGVAWPSMNSMTSKWIPPNERSKFITAYLGNSVGVALFYPVFGFIIEISSWEWVYHLCGILGILWFIGWQYFVYDSPGEHPRCSTYEREYIENSLGNSVQIKNLAPTPWKSIFTSRPVWVIGIVQFGGVWGLFAILIQAPTYFHTIHGWNTGMTGILSGIPHLLRVVFAYVLSTIGDYLLTKDLMSRTNVRKLAGLFCFIINGIFVFGLAYSGCNSTMVMLATAVHGAISTGPLANIVDLSPNFSSILLGITGTFAVIPGFISPYLVGYLTYEKQTVEQWKYIFLISALILFVCGIIYLLFAESNVQPWNNFSTKHNTDKQQLKFKNNKTYNDDEVKECKNSSVTIK